MSNMNHKGIPKNPFRKRSLSKRHRDADQHCSAVCKRKIYAGRACAPVQGADVDCVKLGAHWTMNSSMARLCETLMWTIRTWLMLNQVLLRCHTWSVFKKSSRLSLKESRGNVLEQAWNFIIKCFIHVLFLIEVEEKRKHIWLYANDKAYSNLYQTGLKSTV